MRSLSEHKAFQQAIAGMILAAIVFGWIFGIAWCVIVGFVFWTMKEWGIQSAEWIMIAVMFTSFVLAVKFPNEESDDHYIRLGFFSGFILAIFILSFLFNPAMASEILIASGAGGLIGAIFRGTLLAEDGM